MVVNCIYVDSGGNPVQSPAGAQGRLSLLSGKCCVYEDYKSGVHRMFKDLPSATKYLRALFNNTSASYYPYAITYLDVFGNATNDEACAWVGLMSTGNGMRVRLRGNYESWMDVKCSSDELYNHIIHTYYDGHGIVTEADKQGCSYVVLRIRSLNYSALFERNATGWDFSKSGNEYVDYFRDESVLAEMIGKLQQAAEAVDKVVSNSRGWEVLLSHPSIVTMAQFYKALPDLVMEA